MTYKMITIINIIGLIMILFVPNFYRYTTINKQTEAFWFMLTYAGLLLFNVIMLFIL